MSIYSTFHIDGSQEWLINSSPSGQNGRHFADDIFKCIITNEKFCISIQISLKFVPKSSIGNTCPGNSLAPNRQQTWYISTLGLEQKDGRFITDFIRIFVTEMFGAVVYFYQNVNEICC